MTYKWRLEAFGISKCKISEHSVKSNNNEIKNKDFSEIVLVNVRFEVFTAVTMKNVAFRDIKTQFVPHRRHITSPLHGLAG
jgi:hypothetical protein